jgi:hypothetical protein
MAQIPRKKLIEYISKLEQEVEQLKEELAYEKRSKVVKSE